MQAACDMAFKYAHDREQFGQQIGTFQVKMNYIIISEFEFLSCVTKCGAIPFESLSAFFLSHDGKFVDQ